MQAVICGAVELHSVTLRAVPGRLSLDGIPHVHQRATWILHLIKLIPASLFLAAPSMPYQPLPVVCSHNNLKVSEDGVIMTTGDFHIHPNFHHFPPVQRGQMSSSQPLVIMMSFLSRRNVSGRVRNLRLNLSHSGLL